jgi:hypothetical protein
MALLALATAATGCARRAVTPAELTQDALRERHDTRLAARRTAAGGVEAEVFVWARLADRKLPGAQARLLLGAPDRARVRVASAFGTALDLTFIGDSARVWLPAARAVLALDAAGESLGVREPGRWLVRAMSADWDPPAAAWTRAARADSFAVLSWVESGGESLEVRVAGTGLPRTVRRAVRGDTPVRMEYEGWQSAGGAWWPVRGTLAAESGRWNIQWRLTQPRFVAAPGAGRFHINVPRDATRLTLDDVRRVIDDTVGGEP